MINRSTINPELYLFEGRGGCQYDSRSAQAVMNAAMKKAGIKKEASLKNLCHSFDSHLLEIGQISSAINLIKPAAAIVEEIWNDFLVEKERVSNLVV